jgi:hypothetical protein
MAGTKFSLVFVAVLLALSGCSAFFDFNAFSSMDKPAAPNPSRYQGSGGLANLQADLGSPALVNALKNDPATVQAIDAILMGYLSGGVSTPDTQQAAILYSDLNIQTTSAGGLVQNIFQTVVNGISSTSKIQDLLTAAIPPEALADPAVFSAMIIALLLSNTQYLALGVSIHDINLNGVIDQGEGVPPGTNMGDVAQKAGVAYTIAVIYNQMQAADPMSQALEIQQMYLLATNPSAADAAVQGLTPDPYNTGSSDPYVTANLPAIQNIFKCAGMALPS